MSTATDICDKATTISELAATARDRSPASLSLTVLERKPGWRVVNLGELWRSRELLYFLTLRDIKVRYKQTVLGATWAILQPLATMLVFSLFFGRVAGNPSSKIPYALFVLSGLVPWMFFSTAIASAAQSMVVSQNLVTKIYFPRLIIPMGAVAACLVNLAISFVMLLSMMAWYGVTPNWSFALFPLLTLILLITALGVGTLLSALTVSYRDFRHIVPFLVQFWMFATPSVYLQQEAALDPGKRLLLLLNPAHGLIANLRATLMGLPLDYLSLAISTIAGLGLLFAGCVWFRQMEGTFADII